MLSMTDWMEMVLIQSTVAVELYVRWQGIVKGKTQDSAGLIVPLLGFDRFSTCLRAYRCQQMQFMDKMEFVLCGEWTAWLFLRLVADWCN